MTFYTYNLHLQAAHLHNAAHFHVRVGVFSIQDKYLIRYFCYCDKKQIGCGLAWSVVLSTTIRVITVVRKCAPREFTTNLAKSESARFSLVILITNDVLKSTSKHTPMGK